MRRSVTRTVCQVQHFTCVGQRDHQWMIAPLLLVVHADRFLAFSAGFHHGAVAFDDGQIEEACGLLVPDLHACLVKGLHQHQNIPPGEPSAEIPARRGIGNPLGPECIQIRLIRASEFEVLKSTSASQQIASNVQHVVSFTVRQPELKDRAETINALGEIQLLDQLLHEADSTGRNRLSSIGQFILNRWRPEHRRLSVPVRLVDPSLRATLASFQLSA